MKRTKEQRTKDILESIHFPMWILKDLAWMLGFGVMSLSLAIPTIIISVLLIKWSAKFFEKMENIAILCWLTANTLWMSHEQFDVQTKELAVIMFSFGIIISFSYLPALIKRLLK